jgi:signal transduction histidine kinase
MQIRQTSNRSLLLSMLIIASLIALTSMHNNISTELYENEQRRSVSFKLADQLRGNSNELTYLVRNYTNIANADMFESYINLRAAQLTVLPDPLDMSTVGTKLANIVKSEDTVEPINGNGELPIELLKLREIQKYSRALGVLENQAIKLVEGGKRSIAAKILQDEPYLLAKEKVLNAIDKFVTITDQRTLLIAEDLTAKKLQLFKNYGLLLFIIIAETLAANARNKDIQLNIHVDPGIPDAVVGDPVRVRQILFNIGGNAIKFTEKGRVMIRAFRLPASTDEIVSVCIQVIDSGIGIAKEAQSELFKEFSQAESNTMRRFGGTGLGLSICHRLVELMGGKIEVESELGKGSTFKALEKAGVAQSVSRSKKTMSLTLSGHINRAIQLRDNGTESGVLQVTNNLSRTRVRWIGRGRINDDLSVGTKIELGNQSSISSAQDLGDNGDVNGVAALDERHIEFTITSKTLGKLWMGQGVTASEDTSEYDLSGTGVAMLNGDIASLAGSEAFQLPTGVAQGRTVGAVFSNLDGAGRRDRIRYDTPKFAGFNVAIAHHNASSWDAGVHYGGSLGGVKIAAGLGYADDTTRNFRKTINGSASVLLPFGLSFTIGAANRDSELAAGGFDSDWRYGKIGYRFKGLKLGETRFAVEFSEVEDLAAQGETASYFGIGVIQVVDTIGAELYFTYHNAELELSGAIDPEDIDVVTVGARLKF